MVLIKDITTKIKDVLHKNPQGMSILQIASKTGINRTTVGRYLENLLVSGQVEMHRFGMKKIYALSQRVALSSILSISSELVVQLDSSLRIIYANEPFLHLVGSDNTNLIGKNIEYTPVSMVFDELFEGFIENIKEGVLGKEWSGEFVLSTKDIHLFCRIVPTVFDDGRKGVSVILEDITERKVTEAALLASEKRFQSLVEMLPQSIWECDDRGNVTYVNRRTYEMYGYEYEDVEKGMTIWQTIHPDDRERVLGDFIRASKEEPSEFPVFHEFMSIRKDGSTFPLITYHVPIVHENKITGMRGIGIDISERKRAEEALRESEDRYRTLVDLSPDAIMIYQEGKFIFVNPAALKLFGVSDRDEIIGKGIIGFVHPDFLETLRKTIQNDLEGKKTQPIELPAIRFDGKQIIIEGRGVRTTINGKPALQVTLRDMTERKRAEDALRESEEKYRTLVNRANDAICVLQDGVMKMVNHRLPEFWGGSEEEIVGRPFTDFVHPDALPDIIHNYKRRMSGESFPSIYETTMMRKDGSRSFVEINAGIVEYEGRPADLVIVRDMNERKMAQEALRRSEELYRTLSEASNDLIYVIGRNDCVKYVNSYAAAMVNKPIDQIIGSPRTTLFPPDVAINQKKALDAVFEHGISVRSSSPLTFYGRTYWYDHLLTPLKDPDNYTHSVLGISRDITEQKVAEAALAQTEQQLRNIVTAIGDIVWETDAESRFVYVSPQVETILGYTPYELIGHTPFAFLHPDAVPLNKITFQAVVESRQKSVLHVSHWIHKDGHDVLLESNAIPKYDSNGSFLGFIGIDRKR